MTGRWELAGSRNGRVCIVEGRLVDAFALACCGGVGGVLD